MKKPVFNVVTFRRICQAPGWYVDLWFKHLREDEGLSEEALYVMARKESRLGVPVAVTPPDRESDRYKKTFTNKLKFLLGDQFSAETGYSMHGLIG